MNKVDIFVSLFKFKKPLKLYLLSNDLRLGYIIIEYLLDKFVVRIKLFLYFFIFNTIV